MAVGHDLIEERLVRERHGVADLGLHHIGILVAERIRLLLQIVVHAVDDHIRHLADLGPGRVRQANLLERIVHAHDHERGVGADGLDRINQRRPVGEERIVADAHVAEVLLDLEEEVHARIVELRSRLLHGIEEDVVQTQSHRDQVGLFQVIAVEILQTERAVIVLELVADRVRDLISIVARIAGALAAVHPEEVVAHAVEIHGAEAFGFGTGGVIVIEQPARLDGAHADMGQGLEVRAGGACDQAVICLRHRNESADASVVRTVAGSNAVADAGIIIILLHIRRIRRLCGNGEHAADHDDCQEHGKQPRGDISLRISHNIHLV